MNLFRKPVTWVVAVLAAVVLSIGLYLFQPWRLFTTVEVNEALPAVPAPAASAPAGAPAVQRLAGGRFRSHEHPTKGTATILRLPNGDRVLRIENLSTSDGPDLRVWLTDQPVTGDWFSVGKGRTLELGHLKGNKGNANYAIPAGADLGVLKSVTIWCKRFSVSFGAAALA
ncbi:DM13 domain-containing protein [Nonomuraea typhae]|uniref:DM13 domain-containing protein n=1 Tax=Nonomuraea typhae TaxID=2603600 RepID=UPI0012FC048B|nr:DM13 domain-containing protein [Nonomuraea typhae]